MQNFFNEYSKLLDKSNQHLSYQAIATYLNLKEVLSNREKKFIENHLEKCPVCKDKYDTVLIEDIESDAEFAPDNEQISSRKPIPGAVKIFRISNFRKYSFAALILITIAAIYFFIPRDEREIITQNTEHNDSITIHENEEDKLITGRGNIIADKPFDEEFISEDLAYVESFKENLTLENFINRNVRSETPVQIVFPAISDTVYVPIKFKWKKDGTDLFTLIVSDNRNKTVSRIDVNGNEFSYPGKLIPGLYYWKIETNGKLEAVGKFYIKSNIMLFSN